MSDDELEHRLATALRAPVNMSDGARDRIMRAVHASARAGGAPGRTSSRASRPARHSIVGLAMAASVGSVALFSGARSHVASGPAGHSGAIGDSVAATIQDTLRLMRLLRAGEHRYAFVVDGARWTPDPAINTPVRGDGLAPFLRVVRDSN